MYAMSKHLVRLRQDFLQKATPGRAYDSSQDPTSAGAPSYGGILRPVPQTAMGAIRTKPASSGRAGDLVARADGDEDDMDMGSLHIVYKVFDVLFVDKWDMARIHQECSPERRQGRRITDW